MKQTQEYMESVRTAAQMPCFQQYGRDTVLRLLDQIDALESELKESKKTEEETVGKLGAAGLELAALTKERDSARFQRDNVELLYKKTAQERDLLKSAKPAPVVLTKEIAEAMEAYRKKTAFGNDINFLAWRFIQYNDERNDIDLAKLQSYANQNGAINLVNALQFGYTVEEPIDYEQRLRIDIHQLVTTWDRTRPNSSLVKDIDERLNDYFHEIAK